MNFMTEDKSTVEVIPYNNEQIEHLVDQLIKLQRACDSSVNNITTVAKAKLLVSMESINNALENSLKNRLIIKR